VNMPRLYFCDISRASSYYMLITECVPYASRGKVPAQWLDPTTCDCGADARRAIQPSLWARASVVLMRVVRSSPRCGHKSMRCADARPALAPSLCASSYGRPRRDTSSTGASTASAR
jgi:hypothetical protein